MKYPAARSKDLARQQVLDWFCDDLRQPLIEMRLARSFRAYAAARDQLAESYHQQTGIPVEEFLLADARRRGCELGGNH